MEIKLDLKGLRAERIAKGLTQKDIAYIIGYKDRASYADRENGFVNLGPLYYIKVTKKEIAFKSYLLKIHTIYTVISKV